MEVETSLKYAHRESRAGDMLHNGERRGGRVIPSMHTFLFLESSRTATALLSQSRANLMP